MSLFVGRNVSDLSVWEGIAFRGNPDRPGPNGYGKKRDGFPGQTIPSLPPKCLLLEESATSNASPPAPSPPSSRAAASRSPPSRHPPPPLPSPSS